MLIFRRGNKLFSISGGKVEEVFDADQNTIDNFYFSQVKYEEEYDTDDNSEDNSKDNSEGREAVPIEITNIILVVTGNVVNLKISEWPWMAYDTKREDNFTSFSVESYSKNTKSLFLLYSDKSLIFVSFRRDRILDNFCTSVEISNKSLSPIYDYCGSTLSARSSNGKNDSVHSFLISTPFTDESHSLFDIGSFQVYPRKPKSELISKIDDLKLYDSGKLFSKDGIIENVLKIIELNGEHIIYLSEDGKLRRYPSNEEIGGIGSVTNFSGTGESPVIYAVSRDKLLSLNLSGNDEWIEELPGGASQIKLPCQSYYDHHLATTSNKTKSARINM